MNAGNRRPLLAAALITAVLAVTGASGQELSLANGLLELDNEIGLAYDDNPFLTPSRGYYDQIAGTFVTPHPRSGVYVPFRFKGELRRGVDHRLVASYRFGGSYYPESATRNAREYGVKLHVGGEWVLARREKRETTFHVGPYVGYDKRIYFDRDTGLQNTSSAGADISSRYTYTSLGVEARYRNRTVAFGEFSIEASVVNRNYKEVPNITSLDATLYSLGGDVEFDLGRRVTLDLDYAHTVRDYDNLRARKRDATLVNSNPLLQYTYDDFGVTLRAEATRDLTFYFDYDYRVRADGFEHYNDYSRNSFRVRTLWSGSRTRLRLAVRYRDTGYDNAVIFDKALNPLDGSANPKKSYRSWKIDFSAERKLGGLGAIVLEARRYTQDTTDPRYTYDRNRIALSYRIR